MNPLYARCIAKDHLQSEVTKKHFYIIEFQVKFDDGHIEELKFNTDSNFEKLLSGENRASEQQSFFKPITLFPWQYALFDCFKDTNHNEITKNLYLFQGSQCVVTTVSANEFQEIFSKTKAKSWCAMQ